MYVLPSDDDEGGYLNRHLQELERFPRLHSQIIEVVSDLLRERLSPTSEYAQSLIQIQAAYINTNHPAFVTGSAQAQGAEGTQVKPQRKRVGFFWHPYCLFDYTHALSSSPGRPKNPTAPRHWKMTLTMWCRMGLNDPPPRASRAHGHPSAAPPPPSSRLCRSGLISTTRISTTTRRSRRRGKRGRRS